MTYSGFKKESRRIKRNEIIRALGDRHKFFSLEECPPVVSGSFFGDGECGHVFPNLSGKYYLSYAYFPSLSGENYGTGDAAEAVRYIEEKNCMDVWLRFEQEDSETGVKNIAYRSMYLTGHDKGIRPLSPRLVTRVEVCRLIELLSGNNYSVISASHRPVFFFAEENYATTFVYVMFAREAKNGKLVKAWRGFEVHAGEIYRMEQSLHTNRSDIKELRRSLNAKTDGEIRKRLKDNTFAVSTEFSRCFRNPEMFI